MSPNDDPPLGTPPDSPQPDAPQPDAANNPAPPAPDTNVNGQKVALFLGSFMILVGFGASSAGLLSWVPRGKDQVTLTYGLFILGLGVSMILTQVFRETYKVKNPAVTFAGTLAATWITLWIATHFLFPDIEIDNTPRDLRLTVLCPNSQTEMVHRVRQPLIVVEGEENDVLDSITGALVDYDKIVPTEEELTQYDVEGDIILKPMRVNRVKTQLEFLLPASIRPGNDLNISIVSADSNTQSVLGAGTPQEESKTLTIVDIEINRENPASQTARGAIKATVDFNNIEGVCGA